MAARRDDGSASVLALAVVVVVALAGVLTARAVVAAAHQSAAQHAADAAALAGVEGGPAAARTLAAANGAELTGYRRGPGRAGGTVRVTVTVRRGDRTAEATAEGDRQPRAVVAVAGAWHPSGTCGALRSTECPMATSVRRPPTPQRPTRIHPLR